ncbi:MAG: [FeFe] hydrogenase H-cluster radical SAM maturase HydE [Eubacteriales bacterium]
MKKIIDKLYSENNLNESELLNLLNNVSNNEINYLHIKAIETLNKTYGKKIFLRGLIEFTNYCKNNCSYCGIRAGNKKCQRYRLSEKEILAICLEGYTLGYRTFVLQGGEDPYYSDTILTELIKEIKKQYPDCAVTLSIGERSPTSYKTLYNSGADRFLIREETRSKELYNKLHPNMSYENREFCLHELKRIGYQIGGGFMVGLPFQTNADYVKDLLFLKQLQPHMIGIGPFIPHKDTSLSKYPPGSIEMTCILLSILRLLLPEVLLPATTALGTLDPLGWEKGFYAGANVVMLNLSPPDAREKYSLYEGKANIPDDAIKYLSNIKSRIEKCGFTLDTSRGDHISLQ